MSERKFDLFCPRCNIMAETNVIAAGNGGFTARGGAPILDEDSEYYGDTYYVTLCSRCNGPFLICQSLYGVGGEFETVTEEKILYPNESKIETSTIPLIIKNAYEQGLRSYSASLYEPCALMCRKCLEAICKTHGVDGKNLFERLKNLESSGTIDARLSKWSHEIRAIGNDAAHDFESQVTKEDTRDVLDFTEAILIYVYTLNSKFEEFIDRRKRT